MNFIDNILFVIAKAVMIKHVGIEKLYGLFTKDIHDVSGASAVITGICRFIFAYAVMPFIMIKFSAHKLEAIAVKKLCNVLFSEKTDREGVLFLENIGNLVCPAETDTGSSINLEILSVPEGDDKPLKYPLMFTISNVVLINKIDTKEYFPFDDDALVERVHNLNPDAKIFFASAKTGEGMDAFEDYLREQIDAWNK